MAQSVYVPTEVLNYVINDELPQLQMPIDQSAEWYAAKHRADSNSQLSVYVSPELIKSTLNAILYKRGNNLIDAPLFFHLCAVYSNYLKRGGEGDDREYAVFIEPNRFGNNVIDVKAYRYILRSSELKRIMGKEFPNGLREAVEYTRQNVGIGPMTFDEAQVIASLIINYVVHELASKNKITPVVKQITSGMFVLGTHWKSALAR